MMKLPYIVSGNRTNRLCAILVILCLFSIGRGQVYHSCPVHHSGQPDYENPLFEKWLSAYDVKCYHLNLEVRNTDTRIEGSASILVQAVRNMDTLVVELQDALEVSSILFNDDPFSQDFPATNSLEFEHTGDTVYIYLDRTRS